MLTLLSLIQRATGSGAGKQASSQQAQRRLKRHVTLQVGMADASTPEAPIYGGAAGSISPEMHPRQEE